MFRDIVRLWEEAGGDPDAARNMIVRLRPEQVATGLSTLHENPPQEYVWPHLFYAYAVENTRVYEVFRRVIAEFLSGEPGSRLLLRVEAGDFDNAADIHLLHDQTDAITYDVQDLITHWSMATAREMKATVTTASVETPAAE